MSVQANITMSFFIRKDKLSKDKRSPIYLSLIVNGQRTKISIQREIEPERWDNRTGYVKGNKEDSRLLNQYIDLIRSKVYQYHKELIDNNEVISLEALKSKIAGKTKKNKTLLEVFEYHNQQMVERKGIDFAEATIKRYKVTLKHIREFIKHNYNNNDIYLSQLDYNFVTNLEHYFKTVKSCNHNTTIKYIRNLRKVVNIALKSEWLDKDPFLLFEGRIKQINRTFLTAEELLAIEEKDFKIERLAVVRDIFIFSCYTGYAYIDVAELTPDNIHIGIDGEKWFFKDRRKTGSKSNVPILPKALEIIEKYKEHPLVVEKGTLLPVYSNQKMNAYLKEIADLCGITKNLTYHLARHTFATTVTLTNGVPIESVSSMLGHKDIRTTQIYAKVVESKVSEDMGRLKKLLNENDNIKKDKSNWRENKLLI
ncbi:MAG: hypothetical protein A2033_16090 [Bacteroidetes bacterium GWA2_31_9]|nr:MAG: hypothetical protein A2033_16090 [Bacteroidetes bacterium GWA2_31_9]